MHSHPNSYFGSSVFKLFIRRRIRTQFPQFWNQSMCCDKNETIRLLSLYLRETQAQYNDCLSEASGQGTLMELQRDAIQQLQKMIVRKDVVHYSLLIKAQGICRGHIQDVRIIKAKMDALVRSKMCLEEKYRRIKRLWQEAERQLRDMKCRTSRETNVRQRCQFVDCSTFTDDMEFDDNKETETKLNFLMRENEILKSQLCCRGIEFETFDGESNDRICDDKCVQKSSEQTNDALRNDENLYVTETSQLEFVLRQHLSYVRIVIAELQYARERAMLRTVSSTLTSQTDIDAGTIKNELHRRNVEFDKLIAEARDKEQELGMLQDMRKEFERTEGLEKMNECLKKELSLLRQAAENNEGCCTAVKLRIVRRSPTDEVGDETCTCDDVGRPINRQIYPTNDPKDQPSPTTRLTEECLIELKASKQMLSSLSEKISSFKRTLKQKSDEMAKLQTDHRIIKNDYSILKTENLAFEEKARAELREFRDKLKALRSELRLVGDDYQRLSNDFDKSQELLIEASTRESELQRAIEAMELVFTEKLSTAENETKCLTNLVDMLRCELENSRDEFAAREDEFAERYKDARERIESLEKEMIDSEEAKHRLSRQLQDSRAERCILVDENSRLTEEGCRCVRELEDTHKALLELKGECIAKTKSLDSVSAELMSVATSRTELCEESRHVVCCIRVWMDEQRKLVEILSKKLKNEKNRIAQLTFERKGLVATVRQLIRINGTLGELSTKRKKRGIPGRVRNVRNSKSSYCETSPVYNCASRCGTSQRGRTSDAASGTTVSTRPMKRRCACLRRTTSRRTTLRHENSSWFARLERASEKLCDNSRRHAEEIHDGWQSETGIDEARDFGYQSSASK